MSTLFHRVNANARFCSLFPDVLCSVRKCLTFGHQEAFLIVPNMQACISDSQLLNQFQLHLSTVHVLVIANGYLLYSSTKLSNNIVTEW